MPESPSPEPTEEQYPTLTYRKYKIKRFRRHVASRWFWVAEVWKPGGTKPHATVMRSCDQHELKDANDEADRMIGIMIQNGGRIPLNEVRTDVTFTDNGLDGLNPRSTSGKAQWCPEHWKPLEEGMVAGTHNGIVAGLLLTSLFIQKIMTDGILRQDPKDPYVMEMLRDSYSPFCCFLGQPAVDWIMGQSTPEEIEKSGILKQIEQQLLGKKE